MDRTSRKDRRSSRTNEAGRSMSLASRLARWAGLAERTHAEPLEERRLLFTMTITADDVNPQTGIGSRTQYFGYLIPTLIAAGDVGTGQTSTVVENFDQQPVGAVGSGAFFQGSRIRIVHGIAPPQDIAIEPLVNQQGTQDRWLKVSPDQTGEFFAFELWNDENNPQFRSQAASVSFQVLPNSPLTSPPGDQTGIFTDQTIVELVSNGIVISSFTGAALRAAVQAGTGNPALGTGTFVFNAPANFPGFDSVRVRVLGGLSVRPDFIVDNVAFTIPAGNFGQTIEPRIFGAAVTLAGPIGASATFTDLYGRDMQATIRLGLIPGSDQIYFVDQDDNGFGNYNEGIGRIALNGTDSRTSFTMWGGTITEATTRPADADFWDGLFAFTLTDSLEGLFGDFEGAGFGYVFRVDQQTETVAGLPPGPGSVIIGSPFVRPQNNFNPGGTAPGVANPITTGFTRTDQGIVVNGDINSVLIHGVLHGSSEIRGMADRVNIGYMVGTLSVDGDLGAFISGSDAGMWAPDPGFQPPPGITLDAINKTNGQLVVGRTLGEAASAGRFLMDVTVVGDLNSPQTRPARDAFNYWEKEWNFGTGATNVTELAIIRRQLTNGTFVARNASDVFRSVDQGLLFGIDNFLRNDTIMGAEFIGNAGTGAHIRGELSGVDPFNDEDRSDVFAFPVDGTREIVIEGANSLTATAPYFRIVDQDGRTLAAPELPFTSGRFTATQLRFKPNGPGVYYLVVTDPNGNDTGTGNSAYSLIITGMAPVTVGAIRSGAGFGFTDINSGEGNSVNVLSGSLGSIRVGVGLSGGDGEDTDSLNTFNTVQGADDSMSFQGGTISVARTLYNVTAGSDIGAPHTVTAPPDIVMIVGGDVGSIYSGLHPGVGGGPGEGDLNYLNLQIGGRLGVVDIRGGVGMDQDANDPRARLGTNLVNIRTGVNGGSGDIGMFRTGFHVGGDTMNIRTSPGSVIGAFLTSQDSYTDGNARSGVYLGQRGLPITSGFGSDVRFVDLIRLDLSNSVNTYLPIRGDQTLTVVDDSGVQVQIFVEGAPTDVEVGQVLVFPIDGSQGVAIGQIRVDLSGGRSLRITPVGGSAGGVVGIGRINVVGSDPGSAIEIGGNAEVDVYRIDAPGGLDRITNQTPGGDILFADVGSLNTITITGNLGRTQLPAWGPHNYAPFLGLAPGGGGGVGEALGIGNANLYDDDFNGDIFRPVIDDNFDAGNAYLDDIGGPMDGWLNGLSVRAGSLLEANITGGLGDLILGDPAGVLVAVTVNQDRLMTLGSFDGIFGTIFAADIGQIDVGAGMVNPTPTSPLAGAGIFATDDIFDVTSQMTSGARFSGPIIAGNAVDPDFPGGTQDGINTFRIVNGTTDGLFLASQNLDGFWTSFFFTEDNIQTGDINDVTLTNTNLFRSTINGRDIRNVTITGYFDASVMNAIGNIDRVTATGYRNSTLRGDATELRENRIEGARDLNSLIATEDIQDLVVDFTGRVRQGIQARNIERSSIDVDNELISLRVTNDIRGSTITAGSLPAVQVARNIASSTFHVAGALTQVTVAGSIINGEFEVDGASGAIGTITAVGGFSGRIAAAGPVTTVSVTGGDLSADIRTTTTRGNIGTLTASRDVAITGDISGNLTSITAGRHVGSAIRRGAVTVRGDLGAVSAPNGQLYADLRVGGAITGTVTLGGAIGKPDQNLIGQGSINAFKRISAVVIGGDFDGDIIAFSGGIGTISITNGSFLPGNTIAAYDHSIASLVVTNGSLYGNVHADVDVTLLRVVAGADGVFGDIGINPASNPTTSYDSKRNQLPPGVFNGTPFQGARISAGRDLVSVIVTNGSVFESGFYAGRAIKSVSITGSVSNDPFSSGFGSFFAAGDSIDLVTITGSASDAVFVAGVRSLGTDNRPGGTGAAADVVEAGNISRVNVNGNTARAMFLAGITPGADGVYNTSDDRVALGLSRIDTLSLGSVGANVVARGDVLSNSVNGDGRLVRSGAGLTSVSADLDTGAGTPGVQFTGSRTFAYSGADVTINVTGLPGTGRAFFDTATGRLTLRNTTTSTNVTVTSSTGTIANFDIVTNDESSLGTVSIQAALTGDSDLVVDGTITSLTYNTFAGTGTIAFGGAAGTVTFAAFTGGFLEGASATTLRVNGDYGASNSAVFNEVNIQLQSAGSIAITGATRGTISVDRDLGTLSMAGVVDRASIRVGGSLTTLTAPGISRTFIAVGDAITTMNVGGEFFDSALMAGLDTGRDAAFDANGLLVGAGEGLRNDRVSNGSIGTVTISGNFRESDIVAGYYRNKDGFFGSNDDNLASGRSTIGTVTITGTQVGSTRSSESYRIASTGTITQVRIGGAPFSGTFGNFAVETPLLPPTPVQVLDTRVTVDAGVYSAELLFSQPVDASTIAAALSVSEVRGSGDIEIRLIQGPDFTLSYRSSDNAAVITFSRTITSQNLPQVAGRPGPGVYRFFLNQDTLIPKLFGQKLDGNADGLSNPGDHFSDDAVVGDAGDKITAARTPTGGGTTVDFYAPANLDIVLDNNHTSDGLADTNRTVTIRGAIGDHPDNAANFFSFASDIDLYAVTLQAGQIIRIGALSGPATNAGFSLIDPNNAVVNQFANNATAIAIPTDRANNRDLSLPLAYLIKQTGRYMLAVGNRGLLGGITNGATVPNIATPPGGVGNYNFTFEIFDDLDSGFTSNTSSGDGESVVTAPAPITFAGADGVFGNADDVAEVVLGNFTFTHNRGPDGLPNTADDTVTGDNANGITSSRSGNGQTTAVIDSAIGPKNNAGAPTGIAADVDVFHLNNRQPIAAGTRMKITVRLSDIGGNLGTATAPSRDRAAQRVIVDNRGFVQFGLFETTDSNGLDDALMVFSPTDFLPFGGTPGELIANNGETQYGYDSKGDFFIEFSAPDRQNQPGASGSFAVYLQGASNSDYTIEVVTNADILTPTTVRQNFFIETNGGSVDWLQAGGLTTLIAGFDPAALGFSGSATNGQPVLDYTVGQLVAALNSIYQGAGFDVHFSANASDFEFQPFSTIYLSAANDPIIPIFDPFNLFNFDIANTGFFSTQPFGFSEHSDAFNADIEDEAVVFVPSFALEGYGASQADLDRFVQNLTGAVSRRAGELMGVRITGVYGAAGPFDPQAANSPQTEPGTGQAYSLQNTGRSLSDAFDATQNTDFFLGRQNTVSLLSKIVRRP